MPVDSLHPDYQNMQERWKRCEIVAGGLDAIKKAGDKVLPRLRDQDAADYAAYQDRATFYNATWRTIVGLQGMLFRKPPTVEVPADMQPMLENIDLAGTQLQVSALEATEACLTYGRLGLFIDYPEVPLGQTTMADAIASGFQPFMKQYKAESIINWKTRTINNKTALGLVVLQESVAQPIDEFDDKIVNQWRVLDIVDLPTPNGVVKPVYRVRVIQKDKDGNEVTMSTVFPKINDEYIDEIPFYFVSVDDTSWDVDIPPLMDLVDMNIAHYRVSADYEHGCHFTGLPTPVISGYLTDQSAGEKFNIGSMTAWVFPNPAAKATYLEFTGQGLKSLETNLAKKEVQMAILGARMLEVQNKSVESANTASIHRSGEQSMLSSVAQTISIGITRALKMFARFAGSDPTNIKFSLNRDFFPAPMDSLMLTALIAGWQNSAISYETLYKNLQRGEVCDLDVTAEEEQKLITANPPPLAVAAANLGDQASVKSPKMANSNATLEPTQKQLQNQ